MSEHKFRVGQKLDFLQHRIRIQLAPAACQIVKLLSTDSGDPQYRIKCTNENFERVARESELR
jgi:hypothetical protein